MAKGASKRLPIQRVAVQRGRASPLFPTATPRHFTPRCKDGNIASAV